MDERRLDVMDQNWNEQDRLNEIGLRHEDCSCEECLLRLEEEYDKLGEEHKRPEPGFGFHDEETLTSEFGYNKYPWNEHEDLGEGC